MTMPFKQKLTGKLAERSKIRQSSGVVLPKVKAGMLKDYGIESDRRWDIVHPSELSHQDKFCPRAVWLRITGGPVETDKFDFVRENIFAEGNAIHAKWQDRLRKYTNLWGNWKCLVPGCREIKRDCLEPDRNDVPQCMGVDGHLWHYAEVNLDAEDEALMCGHADGAFDGVMVEFKGLALDTPLPTPSGWTTMGDVQVGEYLIGSDGLPTQVLRKSNVKRIGTYKVYFDGAKEPVICDSEHFWKVVSGPRYKERVLGIQAIEKTLLLNGQRQHRVKNAAPVAGIPVDLTPPITSAHVGVDWVARLGKWRARWQREHVGVFKTEADAVSALVAYSPEYDPTPTATVPMDPYVIGAFIGDGTIRNGSAFITGMPDMFEQLENAGATLGSIKLKSGAANRAYDRCVHGAMSVLRLLGWPNENLRSPYRYIPDLLLRASVAQRAALLQGLMDADGTWMPGRNQAQFTTTSKRLADDVYELVASLGERPNTGSVLSHGFGKEVTAYYVRWTPLRFSPFRLPRKVEKTQVSDLQRTRSAYRIIKAVEPGPDVETQCVMVDNSDHTYLCGTAMTPTHNSVGEGTVRIENPKLYERHLMDDGNVHLKNLWRDIDRPFNTHVNQGDAYLWIAHMRGLPFTKMSYIYESKWNQQVKEFVIDFSMERSQKLVDQAKLVKKAVQDNMEPACRAPGACKECMPYEARLAAASRPRRTVQIRAK
jgi:CRISPR/Cas system-associated exonuclease Cas4 (RecB family)